MNKIDQAVSFAEELLESTRSRPERLLDSASSTSKWKTIYQKLLDLYLEENKKEPKCPKLKCASHLLDKLVQREHLNTLVVNLYPGVQGYSLMLKGRSGADSETICLPYEESELLDYIDAEQLPPLLVDLLDRVQANIFYCGCVIAEIRDYRRAINNTFETRYVLLRPTSLSLLCDINAMTSGNHRWTTEDKLQLESQLLLHVNEPLCLDPSPAVCLVANRFNYQKYKFNHQALKRSVKKYSQTAINKKRKLEHSAAPKHLKLHDFLNKRKDKTKAAPQVDLKVGKTDFPAVPKTCVDMWRQRDVHLTTPENIEVEKYAKALEKPKIVNDNTPIIVEEYTFETERSHGKVYYSRLTIMQRMNEEFYLGQLYVDRDYVESKSQGSTCKFPLGTKANVEKYIRQFREIFTEEGRRQVKISHHVPGQRPIVSYTQTLHSMATTQTVTTTTTQQTSIITQATNLAATITGQLGISSGSDSSGKKAAPIRLSLSLNPQPVSGNTTNSQGTPVTAQLTLNLPQQQHLLAAQRLRQMNIYQGLQRTSSGGSQASTPTTPIGLIMTTSPSQSGIQHSPSMKGSKTPTATPTATPTPTPTPTPPPMVQTTPSHHGVISSTAGIRRLSNVEPVQGITTSHPLHLNISGSIVQALSQRHPQISPIGTSNGQSVSGEIQPGLSVTIPTSNQRFTSLDALSNQQSVTISTPSTGATPPPNVNIANLSGGPPNINIQNITGLQGVNLQSLQNLQNVQVSLGGVNLTGGIAVPMTHTGILVGSIPGMQTGITTLSTAASNNSMSGTTAVTASSFVTMVTAVQPSGSSTGSSTTTSSGSGMLQLPLGVAGNITQIMAGLKNAQGIRAGTPLLLSQIPGQAGQQVQLLSTTGLGQSRAQGMTLASQAGTLVSKSGNASAVNTTSVSAVLAPQSLVAQSSSLTQLRPAAGQPQMLTTQQLVQLTSQQQQLTQMTLQQKYSAQGQQKLALPQQLPQQKLSQQQQLQILQQVQQQKLTPAQLQQLHRQQQQGLILTTAPTPTKPKKKKL